MARDDEIVINYEQQQQKKDQITTTTICNSVLGLVSIFICCNELINKDLSLSSPFNYTAVIYGFKEENRVHMIILHMQYFRKTKR